MFSVEIISTEQEYLVEKMLRAKRDWDKAVSHLLDYAEIWERIASKQMEGMIQFHPSEHPAGPIIGNVLTKNFQIHFSPLQRENITYALVIVDAHSTRSVDPVEACRFLVDRNGNICNIKGEIILSDHDDTPQLTLISNIARTVLSANI